MGTLIPHEQYHLAKTELPPRVTHGAWTKDEGKHSSRLAQIEKQAKKVLYYF
jgi:hypothetical protein